MSLFTWLQIRTRGFAGQRRGAHSSPRRQTTFRPRLEALEGRDVPSTLTVTNNLDSGIYPPSPGSLRYEIAAAQSGDTIVFSQSLKGQTITLNGSELYINKSLDIEGLGAKYLAISGGDPYRVRVFDVAAVDLLGHRVQVTLSGMTIENGNGTPNDLGGGWGDQYYDHGGGILNFGTLTLSNCTVSGNSARSTGGGIANELGGTMTISGCTVSRNSVALGGPSPNGAGGGIYNDGTMTLSGSTVIQNIGGGIYNDYSGVLTILCSTVKSNHYGGDLVNHGTFTVDNCSTIG
jgi:hypothetical protein